MSGGNTLRKSQRKKKEVNELTEPENIEHEMEEAASEANSDNENQRSPSDTKLMLDGLAKISAQIHDLDTELRGAKNELKQEISSLRQDMDRQFKEHHNSLEIQKADLAEAQTRIATLEESNMEANGELKTMQKQMQLLRDKVTESEARARRNNIRIFGLPEEVEGGSVITYLNDLFKKELLIPTDFDLQMQRAHRTPPMKPKAGQRPRHVVVNFLSFATKDTILKKAWQKKIKVKDQLIQFDHDYPAEIVQKRRSYSDIKKVLKERGIRFQTPYTKLRIHWKEGVQSYNSAMEAAEDIKKRGIDVNTPSSESSRGPDRTQAAEGWQRVGGTARRAQERLQEYQRK
ncbi:uncharacterized protein LOC144984066 [Oryzias latipes]